MYYILRSKLNRSLKINLPKYFTFDTANPCTWTKGKELQIGLDYYTEMNVFSLH